MTKREKFVAIGNIAEVAANEEMSAFIAHEIELLDNRKGSKSGMTKTQKENEGIKETILANLKEVGEPCTVTELLTCNGLGDYTNQKISALLRQLVESGKVTKTMKSKKAYFDAVIAE